jgi:hypothetical protein
MVHGGRMLTATDHAPRPDRNRRLLERAGWRTLLDYRENHVRSAEGTLLHVVPQWTAEAERIEHHNGAARTLVATVTACSRDQAWALLRRAALSGR